MKVPEQRDLPEQLDVIDGELLVPARRSGATLHHPDTGALLGVGLATGPEAIERALAIADRIHQARDWSGLDVDARAAALERVADAIDAIDGTLAVPESLNTGIPVGITTAMTGGIGGFFRGAAARLRASGQVEDRPGRNGRVQLHRAARGPAVVLAPWNAPSPTVIGRAAAALAAGCPVIVKPSEWAPSSSDLVGRAIAASGLPAGLFQLVHGGADVGSALVADPRVRVVSFTGGQAAGRSIAAAAAPNFAALQLELGGNNPVVVRRDADLDATAASLAAGMTKLNGQWCEAPGKVIVVGDNADALAERLLAELARRPLGPCLDPDTVVGPMSHEPHLRRVEHAVARLASLGGRLHRPFGVPDAGGWFFAPTVITDVDAAMANEEIFGPVITIHRAGSDDEAVAMANAAGDGLAGYVFSTDEDAALALGATLNGGEIRINGTGLFDLCDASTQSFWGTSGFGAHGDAEVFELFRGSRIVGVDDPYRPM